MIPVQIRSGDRELAGRLYGSGQRRPAILFLHGLHSSQAGYADRALVAVEELGAVCVTFDLGGHGASSGVADALSLRDHLTDAVAAYDLLVAERDVDARRVAVVAASYGAFLASLLTARRPVGRLVLRAPALYDDADIDVPGASRTALDEPPRTSAALDALRRFQGPVLIVESERDETITARTIAAYRDACALGEHFLIAGAGHELSQPEWREAFLRASIEFLRDL
jgi:pimeloyl-ACP methyl ester carboxylesterase